eukprot:maker-scaffold438_size171652-snap-gene-0.42 protein:Tk03138 transcript:maker-scaffold438_size171652-snap-gene-0.42-mRNA-1 annotation:"hypothetical protein DAPPUDRAFT_203278"
MPEQRESWDSRVSFLLACIGYAVGLGNIWRFPYLCYKSGGGAFLIPYLIMLFLCGLPLLFMELTVGQYTRRGPIGALAKICPILKGAGMAAVVISFWLCTYYNVIISWAMIYLGSSFQSTLPWTHCQNDWNTPNCIDLSRIVLNDSNSQPPTGTPSSQEFFDHRVLGMTDGIHNFGTIRWELLGLLVLAWIIVYFCLWKSVKATGKVVYFTATVPYVLLIVFLVRGLTLPGAWDGIRFFLEPQWEKMMEAKVWVYAAAQVFNSIGIAFGSLIAFSSYNRFHGPILRDTLLVTIIDALTCILCGFCVFSTMGNLALEQGTTVDKVVSDGPGLVFVVFPHALSGLPWPQVWSTVFFAMLILLGIDSQFATVEVIITSIKDGLGDSFEHYFRRHEFLVLLVCLVAMAFGIPYIFEVGIDGMVDPFLLMTVTFMPQGGIYFFQIVDYYAAAISLMYIAFFECIAIVWIYGVKRMTSNIKDMTGTPPNWFFRICWAVLSPTFIFVIWMFSIVDYKAPTYDKGQYIYPDWAIWLGWGVAMTSLLAIPAMALHSIATAKESSLWRKCVLSTQSTIVQCPCGCEGDLDDNFEAHGSTFTLIGGCPEMASRAK